MSGTSPRCGRSWKSWGWGGDFSSVEKPLRRRVQHFFTIQESFSHPPGRKGVMKKHPSLRPFKHSLSAVVLGLLLLSAYAPAADQTATWNGTTGNWSSAGLWSTNPLFPNNGNGGFTFDVIQNATSGVLTLDQAVTIEKYSIGNSSTNHGTGFNLTLNGKLTWESGVFSGTGAVHANAGADLILTTFHSLNARTMNLGGSSTWSAGPFHTGSGATLNVLAGASFDNSFNGTLANANGGAMSTFNNAGTFTKSAGTGITDIAIQFNNASTATVNVNAGTLRLGQTGSHAGDFNVASGATLHFQSGTHTLESGISFAGAGTMQVNTALTANVDVDLAVPLTFSGNTLGGAGIITVSAPMTWGGGTISGAGAATHTINVTGGLTISGVAFHDLSGRTMNLDSNTSWTGDPFRTGNGAIINNLATRIFTTNFNGTIDNALGGGTGTFNNHGTFTKSAGTGTTAFTGVAFNNAATGVVNASSGTISLAGGGTQSGAFNIAAGATLRFGGTHSIGSTATFSDVATSTLEFASGTATVTPALTLAGTLKVSGGTATMNGGASVANLLITNGTLNGPGNIAVNGTMTWSNGTISGANSATDTLTAHGPVIIDQTAFHDLSGRTLTINGNTTWTGSPIRTGNGAIINNNGIFSSTTAGTLSNDLGGAASSFNNAGSFNKSAGGTTTIATTFNNTGTVNVSSGAGSGLTINGTVPQHSGTTLSGGTWNVSNSSSINRSTGSDITTIGSGASVSLDGAGSSFAKVTNALNNNQGSFTLKNNRDLTTAGTYTNSGTTRVEDSTTVMTIGTGGSAAYTQTGGVTALVNGAFIDPSVFNLNGGTLQGTGIIQSNVIAGPGSNTIAPGMSPGTLTINGNLTLSSGSTLAMELGGLTQGSLYDYLDVNGVLTLAGMLDLDFINDFQNSLTSGEILTLATANSAILGSFSNVATGSYLLTNFPIALQVWYGAGSPFGAETLVVAIPEPSRAMLIMLGGLALLQRRRRALFTTSHA
jgi:hypothetical protein